MPNEKFNFRSYSSIHLNESESLQFRAVRTGEVTTSGRQKMSSSNSVSAPGCSSVRKEVSCEDEPPGCPDVLTLPTGNGRVGEISSSLPHISTSNEEFSAHICVRPSDEDDAAHTWKSSTLSQRGETCPEPLFQRLCCSSLSERQPPSVRDSLARYFHTSPGMSLGPNREEPTAEYNPSTMTCGGPGTNLDHSAVAQWPFETISLEPNFGNLENPTLTMKRDGVGQATDRRVEIQPLEGLTGPLGQLDWQESGRNAAEEQTDSTKANERTTGVEGCETPVSVPDLQREKFERVHEDVLSSQVTVTEGRDRESRHKAKRQKTTELADSVNMHRVLGEDLHRSTMENCQPPPATPTSGAGTNENRRTHPPARSISNAEPENPKDGEVDDFLCLMDDEGEEDRAPSGKGGKDARRGGAGALDRQLSATASKRRNSTSELQGMVPLQAKKKDAVELHNAAERRRRERINMKLRTLQELIPHSTRSEKAAILDDVIEYIRKLQSQVQLISGMASISPIPGVTMPKTMSPSLPGGIGGGWEPSPAGGWMMGQMMPFSDMGGARELWPIESRGEAGADTNFRWNRVIAEGDGVEERKEPMTLGLGSGREVCDDRSAGEDLHYLGLNTRHIPSMYNGSTEDTGIDYRNVLHKSTLDARGREGPSFPPHPRKTESPREEALHPSVQDPFHVQPKAHADFMPQIPYTAGAPSFSQLIHPSGLFFRQKPEPGSAAPCVLHRTLPRLMSQSSALSDTASSGENFPPWLKDPAAAQHLSPPADWPLFPKLTHPQTLQRQQPEAKLTESNQPVETQLSSWQLPQHTLLRPQKIPYQHWPQRLQQQVLQQEETGKQLSSPFQIQQWQQLQQHHQWQYDEKQRGQEEQQSKANNQQQYQDWRQS